MKVFFLFVLVSSVAGAPQPLTWNTFLHAENIFPVDLDPSVTLKSFPETQLNEANVLTELEALLSQKKVVHEIYENYLNTVIESKDNEWRSEEREELFKNNLFEIALHNLEERAGRESWFKGINGLNHLSTEEFESMYLTKPMGSEICTLAEFNNDDVMLKKPRGDAPSSWNWLDQNMVTPVKNQGRCGDCWAFSTVAIVESAHAIASGGELLDLSEEDVRDCDASQQPGCSGGYQYDGLAYVSSAGGLPSESDYPYYDDKDSYTCTSGNLSRSAAVASYAYFHPNGDEDKMTHALYNYGPLGVLVNSKPWHHYKGGDVFTACNSTELTHAVTMVGYTESTFTIKNSWGTKFGNHGFINLPRGQNACGVNSCAAYVTAMA